MAWKSMILDILTSFHIESKYFMMGQSQA